jgi:integrase
MKPSKLTKRAVDEFAYQGDGTSRDVRWDAGIPGFGVRVYPSGRKAFVLSFREAGRKRLMTLGMYGPLTLDQARNQATVNLGEVIKGNNPLEQRKERAKAKTIGDLCNEYLARHAPKKKSQKDDHRYIDKYVLPRWRSVPIASLKRSEIADLHKSFASRAPYAGNRLLALLRKMFNLARAWGYVSEGFINPATAIPFHKEVDRDRWVTADELPRLAVAIDSHPNAFVRGALWLYLFTGARKSELLRAEWTDVDFERRELRLPDTKAGRPHLVPLSEPALGVLRALPREEGNPYIFPGRKEGAPLVNIAKGWNHVRRLAGIEDVRLHDLRRTVGSWLAQSGSDINLIGKILNHSTISTTAIYARLNNEIQHQALEAHGKKIMDVLGSSLRKSASQ